MKKSEKLKILVKNEERARDLMYELAKNDYKVWLEFTPAQMGFDIYVYWGEKND